MLSFSKRLAWLDLRHLGFFHDETIPELGAKLLIRQITQLQRNLKIETTACGLVFVIFERFVSPLSQSIVSLKIENRADCSATF